MSSHLDVAQPSVSAEKLADARGALLRYRIMAFATGTVLSIATIVLILKSSGVDHLKGFNAVLWIGHGWFYVIYVLVTFALGLKRAKEMLLLGEMITAATAAQIGLVNRVVDDEALDAEVARIAGRIAGLKAEAVAANKRLVNEQYERAGFLASTES